MPGKVNATTLDKADCVRVIHQLWKRFEPLRKRMAANRADLFQKTEAAPMLDEPFDDISYQTDIPRQAWTELRSRMTEHHVVANVFQANRKNPQTKKSDAAQKVLNTGLLVAEQRLGTTIQGMLSDGQLIDGFGVLHWRLARDIFPEVPEYEYTDEIPDGEEHRFREDGERFKETDASLEERKKEQRARAGYPWVYECPDASQVAFIDDDAGQLAMLVWVRDIPMLSYEEDLRSNDKLYLGAQQLKGRKRLRVYTEKPSPESNPSQGGLPHAWDTVTVATLWTRNEWYELASAKSMGSSVKGNEEDWEIVKSSDHPYERVPFEIAPALQFNSAEPMERYMAGLEGIFRVKGSYDFDQALMMALSRRVVLPDFWLKKMDDNALMLNEDGTVKTFTRESALALEIPDGYTLEKVDFDISPAFIEALRLRREEMQEATPPSPQNAIDDNTAPWTARIMMQVATVLPKSFIQNQERAFQNAMINQAMVNGKSANLGGVGEAIHVYAMEQDGRIEKDSAVSAEPEDWDSLQIHVGINAVTGAEQITLTEHGRTLLADKLITRHEFFEDFMHDPDPTEKMKALDAEELYTQLVKMRHLSALLRSRFGRTVLFEEAGGGFMNADGQDMTTSQVLQQQGFNDQTIQPLTENSTTRPTGVLPQAPLQ